MDRRKLKGIDASSFSARKAKGTTLAAAQDDGFAQVDRSEILDMPLVIVAFEITDGFRAGSRYSEVWALAEYKEGDVRTVKFQDGGRSANSVTSTLAQLAQNGVTTDVVAVLRGEPYTFPGDDGQEQSAMRYTLDDLTAEDDAPDF